MFKRIQNAHEKFAKRQKRGEIAEEDQGPRELLLDEESGSDSDSSSSSSSSSASSSSGSSNGADAATSSKRNGNGVHAVNGKKRQREKETETDDEESSEESEESSDEAEEGEDAPPLDPLLRPSIAKALADPIYTKPDAIANHGVQHRSCYFCPSALLKTEKMVETHLASGSHGRRLKRTMTAIEKLSEEQKRDPSDGGVDVVTVVEGVDKAVERKQKGQEKHQALVKQQKKEKKHRQMAAKKERRAKTKAEKEAKKARLLAAAPSSGGAAKAKKVKGTPKERLPKEVNDGEEEKRVKVSKPKVVPKRHRVMPTKDERKAHKKEKRAQRASRKANERRAKRAAAEASAAGGGGGASA